MSALKMPSERAWENVEQVAPWRRPTTEPSGDPIVCDPSPSSLADPYLQAALVGEVAKVAGAAEGERNETLVRATFALGQLEHLGLTFEQAAAALTPAAQATGLKLSEIRATIASGWKAGRQHPRDIPGFSVPQMLEPLQPYPVEALPEPVQGFVVAASRTIGCPPEMVALPLLVYAGATIGNTACLIVRSDWEAFPILWGAVVASPGMAKSPADQAARKGLTALQLEAKAQYDEEMVQYKKQYAAFKAGRGKRNSGMKISPKYLKQDGSPESAPPQEEEPMEEPEKPKLEHFWTGDATIEAIAPMLAASAGLAICKDELAGWTKSFDTYHGGHGSERQAHLSGWSGHPLKVDRKGAETVFVPNPVCCITGGIQPDVLHELAVEAGRRDGFLERFVWSIPQTTISRWSDEEIPVELESELFRLFRELRRPGPLPRRIVFSAEAKRRWVRWYDENAGKTEVAMGLAEGASAKMPVQCARLALILHCLAHGEKAGSMKLSLDTLKAAIKLVDYHRAHGERVFALLGGASDRHVRLREKLTLILKNAGGRFLSRTELDRALGGVVPAKERDQVLAQMKAEGLVEQDRGEPGPQGGRPVERWRWVVSNNEPEEPEEAT